MLKDAPRVAFLLLNLDGGGIERVVINLLHELSRYPISLDLVVFDKTGSFLHQVPPSVRIIELSDIHSSGRLRKVLPLTRYLRQEKPNVLISQLVQFNVIAAIAKLLSGLSFQLILVEHIGFAPLEEKLKNIRKERTGLLNFLRCIFYEKSDVVAAVSQGLAQELEANLKLTPGKVKVLYNPVVNENLLFKAQAPISHPWFQPDQPPVFLAVGRLAPQKDFSTLLQAFAILRQHHKARLVILGEDTVDGSERRKLEALVAQLNLEADVLMPGFDENPYAYMKHSAAFVLSSQFEALPTVLIEALACGCQVISTDCPYGPKEILESGKYGRLVPVADSKALAVAMEQAINSPICSDVLKSRAQNFSVEKTVSEYLRTMELASDSQKLVLSNQVGLKRL